MPILDIPNNAAYYRRADNWTSANNIADLRDGRRRDFLHMTMTVLIGLRKTTRAPSRSCAGARKIPCSIFGICDTWATVEITGSPREPNARVESNQSCGFQREHRPLSTSSWCDGTYGRSCTSALSWLKSWRQRWRLSSTSTEPQTP